MGSASYSPMPAPPRRRSVVLGVVALLTLLGATVLPFREFDGRIDVMLPDRSELRELFELLRDVQVADKVLVTLSRRDGASDPDGLAEAAERFQEGLDTRLATPLETGLHMAEIGRDFARLAGHLPDYLSEEELGQLDREASGEGIRHALESVAHRLHQPQSLVGAASAAGDPLDWTGMLLRRILAATATSGYRAAPVQGWLMDPERRHVLLVLQTPVLMTDTVDSRRLVEHLADRAEALPPLFSAGVVCGHLHTVGNETVIRRDIRVTVVAILLVFLVLFLGVYRDPRAALILLVPLVAGVPALAFASLWFGRFSFIVLGFGSIIAGISVDYGIHHYVAARGAHASRSLALIRRPVVLSALTTLGVFIAFLFSGIPAYRQLGVFAAAAILVSLFYACWALPVFIRPDGAPADAVAPPRPSPSGFSRRRAGAVAAVAAVSGIAGLLLLSRLEVDVDVSKLDGTPQATLDEEARALAIWGGGEAHSAILVVSAPDEPEALRLNDRLYAALLAAGHSPDDLFSLAPLWPSAETRRLRREAWRARWTPARVDDMRRDLDREAEALGFADDAFAGFWRQMEAWGRLPPDGAAEPIGFLGALRDRFLHHGDHEVRIISFMPDEPEFLGTARSVQGEVPGLRVISRQAFSADLSAAVLGEAWRVSGLAAVLIVFVGAVTIRRAGMLVLSVLPALAGLIWGGAGMVLWGLPLNLSNLIAGILVFGLCVDYGICMAYARRRGLDCDMSRAVTLSAVTTILGAAVLLLARHPAFRPIGITLVFGVTAGYLHARLVLPALQELWPRLNPPEDRS